MTSPSIVRTSTADLYDAHVLKNYARSPLTLVRGRGAQVWDDAGNCYLDFTSGIAVSALGHCHPHWVAAVQRQAAELIHVSNLFRNPQQGELARRLVQQAGPGRVFFCNSGAEANEALIKLSRLHGVQKAGGEEGRCYKVICAKNAFHGRTYGGMSATPQEKIQKGFRPLVPGFAFGELNNLQSFADLIDAETAAIFVETIQGRAESIRARRNSCADCGSCATSTTSCCCSTRCNAGSGGPAGFTPSSTPASRPTPLAWPRGWAAAFPSVRCGYGSGLPTFFIPATTARPSVAPRSPAPLPWRCLM
jgi:acetylornithine/succinyldiaminopimelate/putrescine aminotransferase